MQNEIKSFIKGLLKDYSIHKSFKDNTNIFDVIPVYNVLYIVNPIQEKYGIDFGEIIRENDYTVMSLDSLSKVIAEKVNNASSNN